MRAVFLPAGVDFIRANPHWEYTRNKTTKTSKCSFDFGSFTTPTTTTTTTTTQPRRTHKQTFSPEAYSAESPLGGKFF
jgi:hypothetical protein